MTDNLPNPHDAFFRQTFARVETARQFLIRFLPADVCNCLDLSSLRLTSESFVDADLRSSQSDLLFEVPLTGDVVALGKARNEQTVDIGLVYVLFEHKSSPDRMTPFQLLRYMVRIWEKRQKQGEPLQPIVPVIVYHGVQAWTTATTLRELIDGPSELLAYTPEFGSHLIDLGRYNDDDLPQEEVTLATLLLLKYIARSELTDRLSRILQLLRELLNQPDGLENLRAFLIYVSRGTKQIDRRQLKQHIESVYAQQGDALMGTIAEEYIEDGRKEGLQKGLQKGREEGREEGLRIGIQAVVELRFPDDSRPVTERLDSVGSADRLTRLLNLSRTASSIDELVAFLNEQQQEQIAGGPS